MYLFVLNNEGEKGSYFGLISLSHLSCVFKIKVKKETANQMYTVTEWQYLVSSSTLHVLLAVLC